MDLSGYDFKDTLFNPREHKLVENIEEAIPTFKAFTKIKDKKKLYAWIVCVYDMRSPLRLGMGNYYERKRVCAEIVGWDRDSVGHFPKEIERYILGMDKVVNSLIANYLASFNLPQFTQLVAYLEMQYKITQDILSGKIESTTAKTLDFITDKITELTRHIYGSGEVDEVMEARKSLYAIAEKERMKLNVESVVEYIRDKGKLPDDFNPYGDDYMPENLKFISDEGEEEDTVGDL